MTRPYLRLSNVRQSSDEVQTETARPALGTEVQGDTIRYQNPFPTSHFQTTTHTHTNTHKAEKPTKNTLALVSRSTAARGATNGRPRVSDGVGLSHNDNRTRRLPAGVGGSNNQGALRLGDKFDQIAKSWRAECTPALAPPPEEPQTAAPESPTVSGHRTMSTAHAGCLLASEEAANRER